MPERADTNSEAWQRLQQYANEGIPSIAAQNPVTEQAYRDTQAAGQPTDEATANRSQGMARTNGNGAHYFQEAAQFAAHAPFPDNWQGMTTTNGSRSFPEVQQFAAHAPFPSNRRQGTTAAYGAVANQEVAGAAQIPSGADRPNSRDGSASPTYGSGGQQPARRHGQGGPGQQGGGRSRGGASSR